MGMSDRDVDERIQDLERAIHDLTDELGAVDSPSTVGDRRSVASFVRKVAIPAGILAVEAQLRTLEFLAERVRWMNQRGGEQSSLDDWSTEAREHSMATMDRIEDMLDRIELELAAGRLPASREARDLIEEIRRLQGEIRNQLDEDRSSITGEGGESEAVTIDVESELETIRDEIDSEESQSG